MSHDHPLAHLPVSLRIDCGMAILSSMPDQKPGGWDVADLAEICGCSEAAIHLRLKSTLSKIARQHPELREELNQATN